MTLLDNDNRNTILNEILRLEEQVESLRKMFANCTNSDILDETAKNIKLQNCLTNPEKVHVKQRSSLRWDVIQASSNYQERLDGCVIIFNTIRENISFNEAKKHAVNHNCLLEVTKEI